MNYWNELDGSTFFNKVFTTSISIGEVQLFTLNIDNDRPVAILEFDISEYPDTPPIKWKQSGFNTCRIGLNCSNIKDLLIKNIPTHKKLSVTISNKKGDFIIRLANDDSLIEFTTKHPLLCGPSGYINSAE